MESTTKAKEPGATADIGVIPGETPTVIKFLLESAWKYQDLHCMMYLKRGEFVGITWEEVLDVTRLFSLGLQALGVKNQDRVALMANTRYEWRLVDYGILFAGGTTVTIYPSLTTEQVEYIVNDSESGIIVVDTVRRLEKVLKAQPNCPGLKYAICIEQLPAEYKTDSVFGLDELIEKGESMVSGKEKTDLDRKAKAIKKKLKKLKKESKISSLIAQLHEVTKELATAGDPFAQRLLSVKPNDVATIVYTSGTTGVPKGALLTHANMAINALQTKKAVPLEQHDISLSFLPLSHVLERQVSQFSATLVGNTVAFARDTESIVENLDQVKPTFITSVPRIYEKLHDKIIATVVAGGESKQKIFEKAVGWGYEYHSLIQEGEDVPVGLAMKNWLGQKLVFHKVHDILGGRLRFMFSGGAALNPVLARFFFAAGFKIMEGYGLTETSPVLTVNPLDKIRFGTVGVPVPGTDIKIADDGEIICKGPQVFQGYWNKPAENADAFTPDGYYKTGDLGTFTDEGYLKITGRKKTVIVLRTGKKVSPVVTEAAIALDRHVAHACAIGDDMKYLIGIIEPNFEYLADWLVEQGLSKYKAQDFEIFKGMSKEAYQAVMARRQEVIMMPEVVGFYSALLEEAQQPLSSFERVKRFILVPDEWNEYNVLTPSMKMKRTSIVQLYKDKIDSTYVE